MRWFRVWRDTRWFMRHWQLNRECARYFAEMRNP